MKTFLLSLLVVLIGMPALADNYVIDPKKQQMVMRECIIKSYRRVYVMTHELNDPFLLNLLRDRAEIGTDVKVFIAPTGPLNAQEQQALRYLTEHRIPFHVGSTKTASELNTFMLFDDSVITTNNNLVIGTLNSPSTSLYASDEPKMLGTLTQKWNDICSEYTAQSGTLNNESSRLPRGANASPTPSLNPSILGRENH